MALTPTKKKISRYTCTKIVYAIKRILHETYIHTHLNQNTNLQLFLRNKNYGRINLGYQGSVRWQRVLAPNKDNIQKPAKTPDCHLGEAAK